MICCKGENGKVKTDVEPGRKKGVKDNSNVFVQSNWKGMSTKALRGISAIKILDILIVKCLIVPQRRIISNLSEELETEILINQLSTIWYLKPTIVLGKMTKEVS